MAEQSKEVSGLTHAEAWYEQWKDVPGLKAHDDARLWPASALMPAYIKYGGKKLGLVVHSEGNTWGSSLHVPRVVWTEGRWVIVRHAGAKVWSSTNARRYAPTEYVLLEMRVRQPWLEHASAEAAYSWRKALAALKDLARGTDSP